MSQQTFELYEVLSRRAVENRAEVKKAYLREITGLGNDEIKAALEELKDQERIIFYWTEPFNGNVRVSFDLTDKAWVKPKC